MRIRPLLAAPFLLAALAATGCAATPSGQAAAPAPVPQKAAPTSTASNSRFDMDQVVCRRYPITGSRVREQKICKTRGEWDAESRDAQEALGNVDRATQPGGDTLPTH